MKNLAIITARGGSKRIPKKNIKNFLGKPIIAYSIEAALSSGLFSEVMVSTDSEEIAAIAKEYGAVVPFMRSEKTSSDTATTNEVILEVLGRYIDAGRVPENACCIYPTAPFVTPESLKNGLDILIKHHNSIQVTPVVKFSFPPQRGLVIDEGNVLHMPQAIAEGIRSQDLEPIYHDAGQFYWYRVKEFYEGNAVTDGHCYPLILDEIMVQDIDNESDWEIAEMKYEILKRNGML